MKINDLDDSGSVVLCAIFILNKIYIAHVGDSKAIII